MATMVASYTRGPTTWLTRVTRVGSRVDSRGATLSPYVVMDLRGGLETAWGDIFAGVDNVFDILYEDEDGFPQPGRSFEVGISRDLYH
jgi:outer membrane receptor protein involved in Fe transport